MTDPQGDPSNPGFTEQPTAPAGQPQGVPSGVEITDSEVQSKKVLVGVLGILLGAFGVHKFVLGYTQPALIMLGATLGGFVLSFVTCGISSFAALGMGVIGLVEGIIYLTKSDADFKATYLVGKKEWF